VLARSLATRVASWLIVGLLAAICVHAAIGVAAATTTTGRCVPPEHSSSAASPTPLPVGAVADHDRTASGADAIHRYDDPSQLAGTIASLDAGLFAPQTTGGTAARFSDIWSVAPLGRAWSPFLHDEQPRVVADLVLKLLGGPRSSAGPA